MKTLSCVTAILMILVPLQECAASEMGADSTPMVADRFVTVVDNDMWGRPASDRNYTMGVSLAWFRQGKQEVPVLQDALEYVNRITSINTTGADKSTPSIVVLANSAFTPGDICIREPIYNDRPYANLLYFGVGYWSGKDDSTITETQLQIGVLGTSIGREVQTFIHKRCCADRLPQGWDHQIGQGGSPTFLYRAKWIRPTVVSLPSGPELGFYNSAGFEVGYLTRAMAGAALYYGATKDDFESIAFAATANPVAHLKAAPSPNGKGFSAWVDYEISAILHNQLLQGAWSGTNDVRYRWSETEPIVHKLNMGVELTFIPKLLGLWESPGPRLYLTQSWRSRDIKRFGQTKHYWGGFVFSVPM